ncbi:hypothetical protein D1007_41818 [Hordeum vulgare]|nr:hypothetical protein D1007_41818 [Hordeum vulgare]
MSSTRGAWDGSEIDEEHINVHRYHGKLPPDELVAVRVPGAQNSTAPRDGEVVVFAEHFARGLGLPTSRFCSRFLTHYGMQLHHLSPNVVLQLAAFITLCEGFLGIEPCLDLWRRLFFFKQSSVTNKATDEKQMSPCGVALVYHFSGSGFPHLPVHDSMKNWQRGFFYVKNINSVNDHINMSAFFDALPIEKLN